MTTNTITSEHTLYRCGGFTALLGLFAVLSTGCTQEPLCEELGDCGGPAPTGTWVLSSGTDVQNPDHPSCSEDLYIPATDTRLLGGEITPARQPTIEPALFDWCTLLVTSGGSNIQLKPARFYYESGLIGDANLTYTADPGSSTTGTFTTGITRTGTFDLDFPAVCMLAFGAQNGRAAAALDVPAGPPDPAGPPVDRCEQLQVPLGASGAGEGSYQNTDCFPNPDEPDGCICRFDVTETGGPSGRYQKMGDNKIVHLLNGGFPTVATYCNKNNRLQLTGEDGSYLFNVKGLRTLDLGPAATP